MTEPIGLKKYEEQIRPLLSQIGVICEENDWEFYGLVGFGGRGNTFTGYHINTELKRINLHLIDRA